MYNRPMIQRGWLRVGLVLPRVTAASTAELIHIVAETLTESSELDASTVENALLEATRGESFSIGGGIAMPHIEVEELTETLVCLVTLQEPLEIQTIDGRLPDIFLFILSKPDPQAHLHLLAHIARLAQSRTFRDALRRAETPDQILGLVAAAETRHVLAAEQDRAAPGHVLIVISVSGEKAVDALLVDLVDLGFGDASILEAQSLREAAARELPLFADFRDLFGDPGGRRTIIVQAPAERSGAIILAVQRACSDYRARDAQVSVLPVGTHWVFATENPEGA